MTRWSANLARSPTLTGTERHFLQASESAAARTIRRRRAGFAILALLTVMAVAASAFAFSQRAAAVRQRDQAIYNQVIAEALQSSTSDTTLAAQLTLAAYRIQPTPDLASRLLNTENTPLSSPPFTVGTGGVYSVAFSPGGHMLASGDNKGTIRLWDVADPAHARLLGPILAGGAAAGFYSAATVNSLAFSPDAHALALGNAGGTVQLWDVADPARPRPVSQPLTSRSRVTVNSVAFSRDGHVLASGGYDGVLRLWDVADPARPRPLGQPLTSGGVSVNSVAFSPAGHVLASGYSDGVVRLWDVADPARPRPLGPLPAAGTSSVTSVAFSRDGHMLASSAAGGAVRLWDVADPAHPRPLGQPLTTGGVSVTSVAFSPGGHTLASGSIGGTAQMWNLNVQYAIQRICSTAGSLTLRQWTEYIAQLLYQPSCVH